MSSLIQVSESNAIVYISSTPFFGQLTTIRDISGDRSSNNVIIVSTVGITFDNGSNTRKIDTPYATLTVDSTGKVVHEFPFKYNDEIDEEGLTVDELVSVKEKVELYGSLYTYKSISTTGNIDAYSISVNSPTNPFLNISTIISTLTHLGQIYTSSISIPIDSLVSSGYTVRSNLISTVEGLGTYGYMSIQSFQSSVAGIGNLNYYTPCNLTSTIIGLSNYYFTTSNLISTVDGLGSFGYVSKADFLSTTKDFNAGFIRYKTYQSTITGLATSGYVCTGQLASTLDGLGSSGYISSASLISTTVGLIAMPLDRVSSLYISTVDGLGTAYISTGGLASTLDSLSQFNTSTLTSTIDGLGRIGYVSTPTLISTFNGLGKTYISSLTLVSTVRGLFNSNYTQTLVSTVEGLGEEPTLYLSTFNPATSSFIGFNSQQLVSTVLGAGRTYVSSPSMISTVKGLSNIYALTSNFISCVSGVKDINIFNLISTVDNLASQTDIDNSATVAASLAYTSSVTAFSEEVLRLQALGLTTSAAAGIVAAGPFGTVATAAAAAASAAETAYNNAVASARLGNNSTYVSTTQLFSNVDYIVSSNDRRFATRINNLGSLSYISTQSLISTVETIGYATFSNLVSTVAEIDAFNTSNLVSTTTGMASLTNRNSYISSTQLFSTVFDVSLSNSELYPTIIDKLGSSSYKYISTETLISTVQGLSDIYITIPSLISTVETIGSDNSSILLSTIDGLGNSSYISTPQLVDATLNILNVNSLTYNSIISKLPSLPYNYVGTTSLTSTVEGLSRLPGRLYVDSPSLVSTVNSINESFVFYLLSTVSGLQYIGQRSNIFSSNTTGSANSLFTEEELLSSISGIVTTQEFILFNTLNSLGNTYVTTESLTSTVEGLYNFSITPQNDQSNQLISTIFGIQLSNDIATSLYINSIRNRFVPKIDIIESVFNIQTLQSTSNAEFVTNLVLPPYSYFVTDALVSTVTNLYTYYAKLSNVNSMVSNLKIKETAVLRSTVNGLGSYIYVSSVQLISTVQSLTQTNTIINSSITESIGSFYISGDSMISTVEGLGNLYISSTSLQTTVLNYNTSQKYTNTEIFSSINNLTKKGYISITQLLSTNQDLSNLSFTQLASTVVGLSNSYVLKDTVTATYNSISSNFIYNNLASTINGLGSFGYISSLTGYTNYNLLDAERSVLVGATNSVLTSQTIPTATTTQLNIPNITSPYLYIFQSNAIVPSSNATVLGDGISMSNIYCTQTITATDFYANKYYADGTMLYTTSDKRLKFDIVPLSHTISSILQMHGKSYNRIDTPEKQCLGFIAQDMEYVFPELVFTHSNLKSIKYDSIGVVLLEAIKELNNECDELLSTVTSLSLPYSKGACPATLPS
jgi:hypothetical protein